MKKDVSKYLKKFIPKERISWYYQQLLKLYIFKINYNIKDFILVLDADIIFLKSFYPYKNKKPILYYVNTNIYNPYIHSLIYLLPNAKIIKNKSSICHHMLFEKKILNNLLDEIEKKFKKPAWKSILDSVILYVKSFGYKISLFSEYELYANYVKNYYKNNYNFKNISFLDTNLSKFNWKDKQNYKFIGNHSWIR